MTDIIYNETIEDLLTDFSKSEINYGGELLWPEVESCTYDEDLETDLETLELIPIYNESIVDLLTDLSRSEIFDFISLEVEYNYRGELLRQEVESCTYDEDLETDLETLEGYEYRLLSDLASREDLSPESLHTGILNYLTREVIPIFKEYSERVSRDADIVCGYINATNEEKVNAYSATTRRIHRSGFRASCIDDFEKFADLFSISHASKLMSFCNLAENYQINLEERNYRFTLNYEE